MAKQCMLAVIQVMHHRWEIAAGCSTYGTMKGRGGIMPSNEPGWLSRHLDRPFRCPGQTQQRARELPAMLGMAVLGAGCECNCTRDSGPGRSSKDCRASPGVVTV